jgi:general secretion pathway protein C
MPLAPSLRKATWLLPLPLIAVTAFFSAQGVSAVIASTLALDAQQLAKATTRLTAAPRAPASARPADGTPILERNPFDHVTGPLRAPAAAAGASAQAISTTDVWSAPVCDGVDVRAVAAGDDADWSFASLVGTDGHDRLLRRGGEIGGRKVHFVGPDRVWLSSSDGALCQARLFDDKRIASASATPPPMPAPTTSAPPARRSRVPTLSPELRRGIQKVGPTEFNIDRNVVDKILENQADLMRQARVIPVQENGRVVGVRLLGIRPDSLLGVLGMENNDRLQQINGFDMGSPEKALEAYARLRTADKLTVQVNRSGKTMNLDYDIR